jgi:hypothetical protein
MTTRALPFVVILAACAMSPAHAGTIEAGLGTAPFVLDAGQPGGVDLWNSGETASDASTCPSPWIDIAAASAVVEGGAATIAGSLESLAAEPVIQATAAQTAPSRRPMAFEYSDGYNKRLKIHKYASFATLPLFVAQYAVGRKLYNGTGSDSTRSAHTALAIGTGTLFTLNTVTGVMNYHEGRRDPNAGKKRKLHSFAMALADAGFLATGLLAPESDEGGRENGFEAGEGGGTSRSTHRAIAVSSMGVATVGYLLMLLGH